MRRVLRALYWEWLAWSRDPLAVWLGRRELEKHMERGRQAAERSREWLEEQNPSFTVSRSGWRIED